MTKGLYTHVCSAAPARGSRGEELMTRARFALPPHARHALFVFRESFNHKTPKRANTRRPGEGGSDRNIGGNPYRNAAATYIYIYI